MDLTTRQMDQSPIGRGALTLNTVHWSYLRAKNRMIGWRYAQEPLSNGTNDGSINDG